MKPQLQRMVIMSTYLDHSELSTQITAAQPPKHHVISTPFSAPVTSLSKAADAVPNEGLKGSMSAPAGQGPLDLFYIRLGCRS